MRTTIDLPEDLLDIAESTARGREQTKVLRGISGHRRHEFWADDVSCVDPPTTGLFGHAQVTDAYPAHSARGRGSRLATLDRALAELHRDVAELVPTS